MMTKQMEQSERMLAYKTEKRSHSPVDVLRDALDKAERQVVSLDALTIEDFLTSLDQIEQMFVGEIVAQNASFPSGGGPALMIVAQDRRQRMQEGTKTRWFAIPGQSYHFEV